MVLYVAVFIFGALIGSFLNVCIYRIPLGRSIVYPGSFCPLCRKKIPWYLNIPIISFVLLKGKCRFCTCPISLRYPFVEALTGFLAAALVFKFSLSLEAVFWFVFIAFLVIISFIDLDHQIIPDILSLPGTALFASSFYFVPEMKLIDSITGILAGGGLLYGVAVLYYAIRKHDGMGGGDIKLLAMIGAAAGVKGVLFTVFTGSVLGTIAGAAVMTAGKNINYRLKIPFGPFLSCGAVLYIFQGPELIQWYFGILA